MDEKKIDTLLQLSFRAGKIRFGYENINKVKGGTFVIIAKDLSENTKRYILNRFKGEIFQYKTKEELGRLFGKNQVGVIILPRNELNLKIKEIFKKR
ncbi:50S ribosomal protein L7 [Sulfurihydrogenibium subterraneum]|uniref:50S ribosomal protein L7 n=1 Tax=Sulfurihydrogenibium subterraneum TaxID=171121 RepID=UPI00048DDF24|nr:50S ribosomal protein L7 [Sulfurihydrogenibium subterraneum]